MSETCAAARVWSTCFQRTGLEQYDIVGWDPRGAGDSTPVVCENGTAVDQLMQLDQSPDNAAEKQALLDGWKAFGASCLAKSGALLQHIATVDTVQDLDMMRQLVGDAKLNYLGFSYGTLLGATYAALFPSKIGHVVLDGPVDATSYIHTPMRNLSDQTDGFEDSFDRFFAACKADQVACAGFGGDDPKAAFDALLAEADAAPIPADSYTDDPRPVDGDTIRWAASGLLYAKFLWPYLAEELAAHEAQLQAIAKASGGRVVWRAIISEEAANVST